MKKLLFIPLLFLLFITANAQIDRLSGGLAFSSGVGYNNTKTGNPGVFGKAYIGVIKRMHIVPSFIVYKPGEEGSSLQFNIKKNYMFQGDLDIHYGIMRDDNLKLIGFTGANMTGIISKVDENTSLDNDSKMNPGLNLGASIEMNVNNAYDAVLSAKYIVSNFDQLVISLGVIYHFDTRKRRGW